MADPNLANHLVVVLVGVILFKKAYVFLSQAGSG